ncbi:hypothetical protein RFI_00814, partial [Reticulomyxa filosa]
RYLHLSKKTNENSQHLNTFDRNCNCILDFTVYNGLHIINTLSFDRTFMKNNETLSIDITLCLYIFQLINHLQITFNIKTTWSSLRIERQKIETWNLRSSKWIDIEKDYNVSNSWCNAYDTVIFQFPTLELYWYTRFGMNKDGEWNRQAHETIFTQPRFLFKIKQSQTLLPHSNLKNLVARYGNMKELSKFIWKEDLNILTIFLKQLHILLTYFGPFF